MSRIFAQQTTTYSTLKRIKAIGHPATEGFEQHFDNGNKYAGYIATVNNFGLNYRAFPASLQTGRLFDALGQGRSNQTVESI